MFFVLANEPGSEEEILQMKSMAEFEVNIVELVLYVVTTVTVIVAMYQMRDLKYDRKIGGIYKCNFKEVHKYTATIKNTTLFKGVPLKRLSFKTFLPLKIKNIFYAVCNIFN